MALKAPTTVPVLLSSQSTREGTRMGSRICSHSMDKDSAMPDSAATRTARSGGWPRRSSATTRNRPRGM